MTTCVGASSPSDIPEEAFLKRREKRLNGPEDIMAGFETLSAIMC